MSFSFGGFVRGEEETAAIAPVASPHGGHLGAVMAGRVLGRAAGGRAHIERVAAWVLSEFDGDQADTRSALAAYIADPDRLAEHAGYIRAGLISTGVLPADASLDDAAEKVAEAHFGWVQTAPLALRAALDEAQNPPYQEVPSYA
jgi:hypothetical protein